MERNTIQEYLQGKLTHAESGKIQTWLADPANELQGREWLGEAWTNYAMRLKGEEPDFDKMLGRVHRQINLKQAAGEPKSAAQNRLRKSIPIFYRIAAVLIIPLFIASAALFYSNIRLGGGKLFMAERQLYTKPGTINQIDLPDGTKVWLNDGTTLKYPEIFTANERRVFVDGEAYFEVESDPSHPFVVENPMMTTVVTGTSFNLNAYSADRYFEATLKEGKITLSRNNQQIELKPGEQLQFDQAENQILKRDVKPSLYSSWIDGKLILEDEPLVTAVKKLGRWYNVDFVIRDQELNDYLLTATFQDEKLEQTIDNIGFVLPLKIELEENMIDNLPQKTIYIGKK